MELLAKGIEIDQKFGILTAIGKEFLDGKTYIKVKCDCGEIENTKPNDLRKHKINNSSV